MSRLLARYWLLVPLLLGTLLVRDWVEEPEGLVPEEPLEIQRLRADYYLQDFTTRRYDASGALEYLIRGDTLSHYPEDGRAEIDRPRMELHRDGASWSVRADDGTLVRDPTDTVTLSGDVRLERTALPDPAGLEPPPRLEVRAADLSIAIDANEVSTDGPVEVSSPGWRLSAVGLRSSLDAGKLDLRSEVSGRYEVVAP